MHSACTGTVCVVYPGCIVCVCYGLCVHVQRVRVCTVCVCLHSVYSQCVCACTVRAHGVSVHAQHVCAQRICACTALCASSLWGCVCHGEGRQKAEAQPETGSVGCEKLGGGEKQVGGHNTGELAPSVPSLLGPWVPGAAGGPASISTSARSPLCRRRKKKTWQGRALGSASRPAHAPVGWTWVPWSSAACVSRFPPNSNSQKYLAPLGSNALWLKRFSTKAYFYFFISSKAMFTMKMIPRGPE